MAFVDRLKAIILTPATEWPVIERESGDPMYLFKEYVLKLAGIPAVAAFIGTAIVGVSVAGVGTYRAPFFATLFNGILSFVLTFAVVYLVALIADQLAPNFSSQKNFSNALKLVTYAFTPAWLAGFFALIPALSFLTILGLYSFYLLYVGVPVLMKTPEDKASMYTVAIGLGIALVQVIKFAITGFII